MTNYVPINNTILRNIVRIGHASYTIKRVGRGVPRIWQGGGKNFFFQIWKFACRKLLGGFGGMPPRENFLKWCNLVRFGVYFDKILYLKNYHFLYKNFENCNFSYKRINILDTRLL